MRVRFGVNAAERARGEAVEWDSQKTINNHCIVLGDSGSGKTHQLRRMIGDMHASSEGRIRFHVLDSHGDIEANGASTVMFSESTDFGFNPLELNPDRDFGGVRKRIQSFSTAINRTTRKLGPKQEAVLRNLLLDIYSLHGFHPEEPTSWTVEPASERAAQNGRLYLEVPFEEKDRAKAAGAQWDGEAKAWWIADNQHTGPLLRWGAKQFGKRYPTVLDAVRFARQKLRAMYFGANTPTTRLLEDVNRLSKQLQAKQTAAMRRGESSPDADKLEKEVQALKAKTIEAFSEYVSCVKTGRELDDIIKYDSADVMKSVLDRLENLQATGIFRSTPPPFNPRAAIWRYDIKALLEDEKKLFVTFRLESLFSEAVQRGPSAVVREVIVVDEADLYTSDDPDHILNKLVKEARKFGIALVLASQAPSHFSEDMLAGVAVRVFLGLDKTYWPVATRKLGIDEASLNFIVPFRRSVVQMKNKGESGNRCLWVNLPSNVGNPARPH